MLESSLKNTILRSNLVSYVPNKLLRSIARRVSKLEHDEKDQNIYPEPDTRILKVAVIGIPNAGKSTFINSLMDRRVCAVSSRVHTTRVKATAVFTQSDSQIVFLDTPGLVNNKEAKKFNLENKFKKDPQKSLNGADIVGVIHDASNPYTRETLDIKIIKMLESQKGKPSFLVLNKIDVLKSKRKLLDLTKVLTEGHVDGRPIPGVIAKEYEQRGWQYFKEIFMISALTGDGVSDVKNYLIQNAKPGKWLFPEEAWTDQSPETIVLNTVKAVLLNYLPQEIPYVLKPQIEYFEMNDDGEINTIVLIKSPSARISKLVAGQSDGRLRQIIGDAQRNLQEAFNKFVKINIVMERTEE